MAAEAPTRGLRNCNPGNIRNSMEAFEGEVPSSDSSFKEFVDMAHGVRAIARVLMTYARHYKLNTIKGIIEKYAPRNENDSEAYEKDVAGASGFAVDQILDMSSPAVLEGLVKGIIKHENGFHDEEAWTKWVPLGVIAQGVAMALKPVV